MLRWPWWLLPLMAVPCWGFSSTSFFKEEPLWVQVVRHEDGVSSSCAAVDVVSGFNASTEFPMACYSQAILVGADTIDASPDGSQCVLRKCGSYSGMTYSSNNGAWNVHTLLVSPWFQLVRAEDEGGTDCALLGEVEVPDMSQFPLACESQAALLGADTYDFRPTRVPPKCYFKRCGAYEDIVYSNKYGNHHSYTLLGNKKWRQLTRAEDEMGSECLYIPDSFEVVNMSDFPMACYSQALLRNADTFDFRPTNQKCYFKRCSKFVDIKYSDRFGFHDVYTILDGGGIWTQLTIHQDGQSTDCTDIASSTLMNVSDFPSACYSQATLIGADTFDYRLADNTCNFKRCETIGDIKYTASSGRDSFTTLREGWARLTRAEDGKGSDCAYLNEDIEPDMALFPDSCFSHAAVIGADTFDFRPTRDPPKCYFKRCEAWQDIKYTSQFGAHDVYTTLWPRGNDGWGDCIYPNCFELNIFYTADIRGRFVPVETSGLPCDPLDAGQCAGGHARRLTYMEDTRRKLGDTTVFVDLGGSAFGPPFDGHPDYPEGGVAAELMNMLPYDFCLFSQADLLTTNQEKKEEFARSYLNRTCPWLISNVELGGPLEPLNSKAERFKVVSFQIGAETAKIGFVGFYPHADNYVFSYPADILNLDPRSTLQSVKDGTFGRPLRFDSVALEEEVKARDGTFSTLNDHSHDAYVLSTSTPNDVVQAANEMKTKHPDVRAMVLLVSKVYRFDQLEWLKKYGPFDVILMAEETGEDLQHFTMDGTDKLRVYTGSFTFFGFGQLRLRFDQTGNVTHVEHFKDIALDPTVADDPTVNARLSDLYEVTRQRRGQSFGMTTNPMTGTHRVNEAPPSKMQCYYTDCPAGKHVGAAALWKARNSGHRAQVSLLNLGGYRQVLPAGNISIVDCENTLRFRNILGLYRMSGNDLYLNLLTMMKLEDRGFAGAGMRASFHEPCWKYVNHEVYPDFMEDGPPGSQAELEACKASGLSEEGIQIRIVDMEIFEPDWDNCEDLTNCPGQWVQLQKSTEYLIVTTSFMAGQFQGAQFTELSLGTDASALCDYVQGNSPLHVEDWTYYRDNGKVQYATSQEGWATGNRNPSVVINVSRVETLPLCPDGQYLDAMTNKCVPCPAGTRSIEAISRERCDDCPPGFYNNASGQSACIACSAGLYGSTSRLTVCAECGISEYSEPGAVGCSSCPRGSFGDRPALAQCSLCEPGTFNSDSGRSACEDCQAGTVSNEGALSCMNCRPGEFGDDARQSECQQCAISTYSNESGQTACTLCGEGKETPERWTTMQTLEIGGRLSYTYQVGAKDSSSCGCDTGTWVDPSGSRCTTCTEGLDCPGLGRVFLKPGYAATEAGSVFECHADEERCPGGVLGTCAQGRHGQVCEQCEDTLIPDDNGTCKKCTGGDFAPFILATAAIVLFVLGMYIKVDRENAQHQSRATLVLAISAQQLVLALQMLTVLGSNNIKWHEPVKSIFEFVQILVLDIDMVNVNCVANLSPMSKYVGRLFLVVAALALVVFYHFLFVIIFHRCKFMARMRSLVGVIGTVLMMFFIAILGTILLSLQCDEHPNHKLTVHAYPSIVCWEGGDHTPMLIVALCALVFPLGFLAKCTHVVYVAPERVNRLDVEFMLTYNFLFFRFTHEARWYSLFFLIRNAAFASAPLITSMAWQITALQFVMLISMLTTTMFMPWRVPMANVIDIVTSAVMSMILTLAAFQAEETDRNFLAVLATIGLIFMLSVVIAAIGWAIYNKLQSLKKKFQFFLCHHKAHAGAMARLLKMYLTESHKLHGKVFVDSDDLTHLDKLFDYVANHLETLAVLCTSEILYRPWCVGEITTAFSNNVKIFPIRYADFKEPDEQWLRDVTGHVSFDCLTENGLTVEMVRAALDSIRSASGLAMPEMINNATLQTLTKDILAGKDRAANGGESSPASASGSRNQQSSPRMRTWSETRGSSKSGSRGSGSRLQEGHTKGVSSKVFVGSDRSNFEGVAAARILSKLVTVHCSQTPEMTPILLGDLDPASDGHFHVPHDCVVFCLTCTQGCFTQVAFLRNILEAMEINCFVIPAVAGDGFRFPNPLFYQDLGQRVEKLLEAGYSRTEGDPEAVVEYVMNIFKSIAIVFQPHGSMGLLQTQALEMFKKISDQMGGRDFNAVSRYSNGSMKTKSSTGSEIQRARSRRRDGTEEGKSPTASESEVLTASDAEKTQNEGGSGKIRTSIKEEKSINDLVNDGMGGTYDVGMTVVQDEEGDQCLFVAC